MEKCKSNFKSESHNTTHTFKNYFATVFSAISFQFSTTSNIQTHSKSKIKEEGLLFLFLFLKP